MKEIWKDVAGYEGRYQVSSLGRIKSLNYLRKKIEHLLSPGIIKGHFNVSLRKKGKGKSFLLHRLVAQAFVPNLDNEVCINHIDGNKQNNNVSNLEWCSRMPAHRKTLYQYTKTGKLIKIWGSMKEAQKSIGISQTILYKVCNGKTKSGISKGFRWSFIPLKKYND